MGQIDAVDTSNNTYRITFDRQGLGTHSVPDYEVLVLAHLIYLIGQTHTLFLLAYFFFSHLSTVIVQ